jgi:Asp/Glu/hydantoin racemase
MAEVLRRRLGIPVIDPVTAAGSMLVAAVAVRELQPA